MPTLQDVFSKKDFYDLSEADQFAVIKHVAPDFDELSSDEQKLAYDRMRERWGAAGSTTTPEQPQEAPQIPDQMAAAHEPTPPPKRGIIDRIGDTIENKVPLETRQDIANTVRGVTVPVAGLAGAGLASPTVAGVVAGGALGATAASKGNDWLDQRIFRTQDPKSAKEELIDTGKQVAQNALMYGAPAASAAAGSGVIANAIAGGSGYAASEEVEKLDKMRRGEYRPQSAKEEIKQAAKNIAVGTVMDLTGQAVAGTPRAAGAVANAARNKLNNSALAQDVAAAESQGIKVATSDVKRPRTFIGKAAQRAGEAVPVVGTGRMRRQQQEQRIKAVKDTISEFGVDADTNKGVFDDVMSDLSARRKSDLSKYARWKTDVFNRLDSAGNVNVDRTIATIDNEIARLKEISETEFDPAIAKFESLKRDIQGKSISNVDENRRVLGGIYQAPDLATIRDTTKKSVDKIYGSLVGDMGDFINSSGGNKDLRQWKVANKRLSEMAGEIESGTLKSVLKRGDATPEDVKKLLFSKKPSEIRLLAKNLTQRGRENAKTAIMFEAAERTLKRAQSEGFDNISPEAFSTNVKKLGDSIGVFFKGQDLQRIKGLQRALELTKRAGEFAASPPTGVQNYPFISGAALGGLLGGTKAVAAAGSVGGIARVYESRPVRNLLLQLSYSPKGSPREAALYRSLMLQIKKQNERERK